DHRALGNRGSAGDASTTWPCPGPASGSRPLETNRVRGAALRPPLLRTSKGSLTGGRAPPPAKAPPVVDRHRPALVITPAAGHLQVARRETLEPEARALDEGDRGGVLPLNIRLDAMQPHGRECVSEDEMHALRHVALTDVGLLGVVANVGALKH